VSQTRWYQERSKESYYRRAKKEGYRARSAYKLQQVNEKYQVVRDGDAVADLGCAPGGWLQVLVEAVGSSGCVVGVDLQRIKPIPGAKAIQGDFTVRATHDKLSGLLAEANRSSLDAVVSDMAPDMSGNYDIDQFRSVHLADMALDFADKHLKKGGHFVCKVFEGADFMAFRNEVKARFKSLYQFHPPASRKSSSEIYLIAKGFKGAPKEKAEAKADGTKGDAEE
jgi:23S rRNA (uridine2552-2'-O)-methyltransferase